MDSIAASLQRDRAERDFEGLHAHLMEIIGVHVPVIARFKIAAYPKSTDVLRGEGLTAQLDFWLAPSREAELVELVMPKFSRAVGRLLPKDEDAFPDV